MGKSVNKVTLLGNVGKEPEVRTTPGGTKFARFSLATSSRYKDKSGEWQEKTEWHNIVAWQRTAEIIEQYVKKGNPLYIEGRIENRSWDDKETGQKKYMTEIHVNELVLLSSRGGGSAGSGSDEEGGYGGRRSGGSSSSSSSSSSGGDSGGGSSHYDQRSPDDLPTAPITDDDVPF